MKVLAPFLLIMASALAGCSGESGPQLPAEWRGRDLRQPGWTNTTLQPEWTLVLEYPMSSGAELEWDFFTLDGKYVYFQLLKQEGGRTPTKLAGRHSVEEKDSILAPSSGVYQIVWMNDAPFEQSFTWRTSEGYSQRMYPPNEGPGCMFGLRSATMC